MRNIFRMVVALAVIVAGASSAFAAKRVALVVGNASYKHTRALRNPLNDANDMAKRLEGLGFDVTKGLDLAEDQFADTITRFFDKLKGAEVALFYYAGHGVQHQSTNYLVPVDARLKNQLQLKGETVSLNDIVGQMEALSPISLVFLDACRNNPLAEALQRSLLAKGRNLAIDRGLARIKSSAKDTLITFAAAPGATASDGTGRNSPFTAALLKHIGTANLEIEVMLKRVTADVRKSTGARQEPERLSKLTQEFYFKTAPGKAPAPKAASDNTAEIAFWNSVKDSADARELKSYLTRFPNGVFTGLAQARVAKLERKVEQVSKKPAAKTPAPVVAAAPQTPEQIYQSGVAYLYGRGVTENHGKAFNLFFRAASLGHAKAMYATALLYREGVGVKRNLTEAVSWLRKAAAAGDERAIAKLNETLQQIASARSTALEEQEELAAPTTQIQPFQEFRQRFKRKRRRHEGRRNNGRRRASNGGGGRRRGGGGGGRGRR